MAASRQFNHCLRQWAEVFMHRAMRDFVRLARDQGLSMGQMSVLMRLRHEGVCGVSDIGEQLGVTSAAASQMIDRLSNLGLVERTEDPDDRRVKQLRLTAEGRALLHKAVEARDRWMDRLAATLSPDRQATVVTALGYLTEAANGMESPT